MLGITGAGSVSRDVRLKTARHASETHTSSGDRIGGMDFDRRCPHRASKRGGWLLSAGATRRRDRQVAYLGREFAAGSPARIGFGIRPLAVSLDPTARVVLNLHLRSHRFDAEARDCHLHGLDRPCRVGIGDLQGVFSELRMVT